MAYRSLAPATSRRGPVAEDPRTDPSGPQRSGNPSGSAHGNTSSAPMSIPGSRRRSHPLAPPPLPPPTHIAHCEDASAPDLGWIYGNAASEIKQIEQDTTTATTPMPRWTTQTNTKARPDHEHYFPSSASSSSRRSITSPLRSPLYIDTFVNSSSNNNNDNENYRDHLSSPSGPPADNMFSVQRQSVSHAYDNMLKRKIDASTPGRASKQASFDLPQARGPQGQPVHKALTLRSLSLQDSGPSSPRKLPSSNNPHWDPGSNSILPSPSLVSSQQSYFSSDLRGSPITDTFSSAGSPITSYGGSTDLIFGRNSGPLSRSGKESNLSLAMNHATASPARRSSLQSSGAGNGSGGGGGYTFEAPSTSARQNSHLQEPLKTITGDSASRTSLRPYHLQEDVVILPNHHATNASSYLAHSTSTAAAASRHSMPPKRKGAPDSSERDGPPSQQLQQEGRRSPNPISKAYPSRSNPHAQVQHVSSSGDRLPPSVNPLSDHDPNSPYLSQLPIDPGLDTTPHAYPIDAQQLATEAARTVAVNNGMPMVEQVESLGVAGNTPIQCACCPKKPKRFNTEQELRAHMNEKQYVCHYCRNRFKNKNEMERHQMSLHLRDRSWSCAALERNAEAAFHPATAIPPNNPGHAQQMVPPPPAATDVCGYCGMHFPNPPDYVARGEHLTAVHKFAECNQSKKFWRADHFRQHLKHSHGGIPGKWTNMLEQACLKVEPSPLTGMQQQDDGGGMALPQVARAAQAAAEQAAQHHKQNPRHSQAEESLQLPPLTAYQATQLQNATGSVGMGFGTDSSRGPYPTATNNDFGPVMGGNTAE